MPFKILSADDIKINWKIYVNVIIARIPLNKLFSIFIENIVPDKQIKINNHIKTILFLFIFKCILFFIIKKNKTVTLAIR